MEFGEEKTAVGIDLLILRNLLNLLMYWVPLFLHTLLTFPFVRK